MTLRGHVEVESAAELRAWLRTHHASGDAVWLVTYKKAAGERYLPYDAIVEQLLAWGWVDSKPGTVDALRSKRLIAPRKPNSAWSKANRERIALLERNGRLEPPGRAVVDAAKANGAWDRLKRAETARAPQYLSEALAERQATAGWRRLTKATRKRALEWLLAAKTDATRAKRVRAIVASSASGEDPTRWTPKR